MKVVALVSGGKDSCFSMMQCVHYGHEIVALANLLPADDSVDDLDSYMYQTVGHQIVVGYANCMGVPLFRRKIQGTTRDHSLGYHSTPGDEVEDMFILLKEVKRQIPSITAVSSGAIASDYQRLRVESVCSRLGLVSLAYLWKQDQSLLLQEMIRSGIVAIIVKVAAIGLDPSKHLSKEIASLEPYLHKLKELYGINVCGEGGEYETLTLDCPLFKNARIVLDDFQVVRHSSDSIAPVGILHPVTFHLENKVETVSSGDGNRSNGVFLEEMESVCDVQGDSLEKCEANCQSHDVALDLSEVTGIQVHISKTNRDDTFSISCWLQDSSKNSSDLQMDLQVVLMKIESQLSECDCSWENVLYIHLYIADMNGFTTANETYVRFITQENCRFGVPSRSTIELPLLHVGLGRAYVEVLVAHDQSKRVLHVQSISCWAPSCIGPYSQATLHKGILQMAGQLGLDPPTMLLCDGGPTAEIQQALVNSESVAKCFNCSISTSALLFVVYCSTSVNKSDRTLIHEKLEAVLKQMKSSIFDVASEVLYPIFLYVLVPDLPKRAFVEVKPVLHVAEDVETVSDHDIQESSFNMVQSFWDFHVENWRDLCLQKCVVQGKICAIVLSITDELAVKICSESTGQGYVVLKNSLTEEHMERIAKFCIYFLDKVLLEHSFSWDDTLTLRLYFPTSLQMSQGLLSKIFTGIFNEFAEMSKRIKIDKEPILNLVPVLGSGKSATSMNDIITCELFARKP